MPMNQAKFDVIIKDIKQNKCEKLSLINQGIDDDQCDQLADAIKDNNQTLKTLNLEGNNVHYRGARALVSALEMNFTLCELTLNNNINEGIRKMIDERLAQNKKIAAMISSVCRQDNPDQSLSLGNEKLGNAGAKWLADVLKGNKALKKLGLWGNEIGAEGARALANALETQSLQALELQGNKVGNEGAIAIAYALRKNTTLHTLYLGGSNEITDVGVKEIAATLSNNLSLPLRELTLGGSPVTSVGAKMLAEVLKKDVPLVYLGLNGTKVGNKGARELATSLETNQRLQTLDLVCSGIRDDGVVALAKALEKNQTLKTLKLTSNRVSNVGAKALADALEKNFSLCEITLDNNINEETRKTIEEKLERNKKIATMIRNVCKQDNPDQTLYLGNEKLGNGGAKMLSIALKGNKTLQKLGLWGNGIGCEGAKTLASALETQSLQVLELQGNKVGDEGAIALANVLKTSKTLHTLYLGGSNEITDKGVKEIAAALSTNLSFPLRELTLGWSPVTSVGAKALAEALKKDISLQYLGLNGTKVGDEGARALATSLETNKHLQTLDLECSGVNDAGVVALAKALEENESLQALKLAKNNVTDEGAKALAKALKMNFTLCELTLNNNINERIRQTIEIRLDRNKQIAKMPLDVQEKTRFELKNYSAIEQRIDQEEKAAEVKAKAEAEAERARVEAKPAERARVEASQSEAKSYDEQAELQARADEEPNQLYLPAYIAEQKKSNANDLSSGVASHRSEQQLSNKMEGRTCIIQ